MLTFLKVGVSLLTLVTTVSSIRNSKYIKTKVKVENAKCKVEYTPLKISTRQARSSLHCGSLCSSDGDCRRYQFNSRLKQCQLFDSGDNCYVSDEQEVESTVCFRLKFLYDDNNNTRCPIGYYGDQCQNVIKECRGAEEGLVPLKTTMSFIRPSQSLPVIEVKCNFKLDNVIIFFRKDSCNYVDFNRTWDEYVTGFGDPYGNYWIGLEYIYCLSQLHTEIEFSFHAIMKKPKRFHKGYYHFNIANKSENYRIYLHSYVAKSNTDDVFTPPGYSIDGRPFSTYDRDFSSHDCPGRFNGGWWFLDNQNCSLVNLVGKWGSDASDGNFFWFENNTRFLEFKRFSVSISKFV